MELYTTMYFQCTMFNARVIIRTVFFEEIRAKTDSRILNLKQIKIPKPVQLKKFQLGTVPSACSFWFSNLKVPCEFIVILCFILSP